MQVLYFYQYFTTPKGAWSTRVYEFAQRWIAAGDSVTVVTSVYDKSDLRPTGWISRMNVDGIDVRVVNVRLSNRHSFLTRIATFAWYALVASWYALTLPADVVIASSGPISVALPGLVARYLRRRPLVFEVRDLWPEGAIDLGILRNPVAISLARFCERTCYRASRRVVALSEGMAAWIRTRYRCDHVAVVPNAADNERICRAPQLESLPDWARSKKLVLYAGTIGVANECRQVLEMCRLLKDWGADDISIVIMGDGKERPALEAEARATHLDNIHFLGLAPKDTVFAWLRLSFCSLLVFRNVPSLSTVSPNKMFDSLAAGVPVIQNTQGWIKDLLGREECGLSTPPGDAEAMARAILTLARDQDLWQRLSANATRVAREQFDRDLLARRMREVLLASV